MKKLILVLIIICCAAPGYCLQVTGKITAVQQEGNTLYFDIETIEVQTSDSAEIEMVLECYLAEYNVLVDYDSATFDLNFIHLDDTLYPTKQFSQIVSFLVGAWACIAFIQGIKLKFYWR